MKIEVKRPYVNIGNSVIRCDQIADLHKHMTATFHSTGDTLQDLYIEYEFLNGSKHQLHLPDQESLDAAFEAIKNTVMLHSENLSIAT